jgi:predicted AlkP superfamily phosphohydrolase/phosphomutase
VYSKGEQSMGRFISEDALSEMCLQGIKSHVQAELRDRIIGELEAEIEAIVEAAFAKFKVRAYEVMDIHSSDRKVRLDMVFMNSSDMKENSR